MNREIIEQARIPDAAFVYGGVRGRTMSSSRQAHAWKALLEAGIRQVIDLRQDYQGDRYRDVCQHWGVQYFHYPVHKGKDTIAKMVRDFPLFCEMIDRGDFFISCAQGLHRTDIALCAYWVFYGADRGKEPPVLVGYIEEKGHNAGKIMHVLNAMYQQMTEQMGKEPMSLEVFKERKAMIRQLSGSEF